MRRRYYIPLIIIFLGWCKAGAQELPLTHYTSDSEVNPLPSALVTNIYQDRLGYIWFSVFTSGLVRYDGSRMEVFNKSNGLRDLGVWQMLEDEEGYLWVSSGAGLVVSEKPLHEYDVGLKVKFTSYFDGKLLTRDAVRSNQQMAVDKKGNVWIGTANKGILKYHIDENAQLSVDSLSTSINGKDLLEVNALVAGDDGQILVGLDGGILVEYINDKAIPFFRKGNETENSNFTSLHKDEDGGIWAYRQDGDLLYFRSKNATPKVVFSGTASNVTGITSLKDGTLLAGNGESGITRINQKTREVTNSYSRANGLLSSNVYHTLEDQEGNVWIAQSGGVSKLRYNFNAFENFTARSIAGEIPVLPSGKINTVLVSNAGNGPCRFWVGTEGGATCINSDGSSTFITQKNGLTGDWVNGLSRDEKGRVWIATTRGLNAIVFEKKLILKDASNVQAVKIFDKEAYLFSITNSPPFIASENILFKDKIRNISKESIWFPGLKSLYVFSEDSIYEFGPDQGLPSALYKSVAMDDDGHIFIGTHDHGLYRSKFPLTPGNLSNAAQSTEVIFEQIWSLDKGFPTNQIEKLLWHKKHLWVGTQVGLFKFEPSNSKIVSHVQNTNGLPADNAVSFAVSPVSGNLWVGTNNGLAEVVPDSGEVVNILNRQDGLVDNEVWLFGSVKIDNDGNVYYGTSKGVSIYHPENDQPNTIPPQLRLTSADISYKSDSRNEVNVEYAALSFANVAEVKYRTRLLGYDNNWSEATSVKRIRYTNLPAYFWPKEYILEVMAVNESGVEALEPLRYKFVVEPVWWLQWWAFLMYLVILSVLIYIANLYQRRHLVKVERDNARLREAQLQAETATARSNAAESQALALQAENEKKALELEKVRELKKAYNELKDTQKQLIQAEKMASLGRLATGVAHEIKNPLNFINNFAELSVEIVEELEEARKTGNEEEISFLMQDLKQNSAKIGEHGKRADAIIKLMMQHARGGKSIYEFFDINDLVEKYTEVAYQGKRNQHPGFRASIEKDLDPKAGQLKVVGQEIGQVLLNVIGNSLDAVLGKKLEVGDNYEPEIKITTRKTKKSVEIVISDNGPGIPENIKERIFEPFFTTKPTGEGTGLGLSLSYNIIAHGHNGSLRLINNEEVGAAFVISLPIKKDQPKDWAMA